MEAILASELPSVAALAVFVGTIGWVITTWLRVRHGYPLESMWGTRLEPTGGGKAGERIRLLTADNARLAAELDAVKDRLVVLERLATDRRLDLAAQIDGLPDRATH